MLSSSSSSLSSSGKVLWETSQVPFFSSLFFSTVFDLTGA